MAEEVKVAPVVESKDTKPAETKVETPAKEVAKDVKVGEALKTVEEKKEPKMVPEAVLIEYKKESKEVRRELDALKKSIEEGATKKEVSTDMKALAEKHGVEPEFLKDFAAAVRKEAKADAEAEVRPIKDAEQASKLEKIFNENLDKTLEEHPEYKKLIVKKDVRRAAFDPENSDKTFAQILEDSYGHLVTGKKTLESTKARGGKEVTGVDYARAKVDGEYFKEIMADPELKKQYNDIGLLQNRF